MTWLPDHYGIPPAAKVGIVLQPQGWSELDDATASQALRQVEELQGWCPSAGH